MEIFNLKLYIVRYSLLAEHFCGFHLAEPKSRRQIKTYVIFINVHKKNSEIYKFKFQKTLRFHADNNKQLFHSMLIVFLCFITKIEVFARSGVQNSVPKINGTTIFIQTTYVHTQKVYLPELAAIFSVQSH